MKTKKAYKLRLKPSREQSEELAKIAGHCRFLWNKVLAMNLERLKRKESLLWYYEADFWSKVWKRSEEYGFLKEAPAHCLQQKLKDLTRAFKDAFDKTQPHKRLPKFRKRVLHDSFRFPEPKQIQIDNRRLKLPKLGWIGFFKSQTIKGELRNATISREAGSWYISLQVEVEQEKQVHQSKSSVGIDVGIANFAALSSGQVIEPTHAFKRCSKRLAKTQRRLSKKQRFSSNWQKEKTKIQKVHRKISHIRRDFLHKSSTMLCKNHAMIVVEDLNIANMSRSAKGSIEEPGRQVKAKSGLNKSILDQGWGEFRRQLKYKQDWLGGLYLEVDPKYTSQRCVRCGHTASENRQTQSDFVCQACGYEANADMNAAQNILAAGHAVLACGEIGLPNSLKQEPLGIGNLVPI